MGRPVIQGFVGSMDYIRARKGVIMTTSTFTKDAMDFVDRIEGKKVVLINGDQLADLMIDHGLGVTTTKTYRDEGGLERLLRRERDLSLAAELSQIEGNGDLPDMDQ